MPGDFDAVIKNARALLGKHAAWVDQYKAYAGQLNAHAAFIAEKRTNFREWAPLHFYITTSLAKDAKTRLVLDVRYMGQNVAILNCDKNDRVTISTIEQDEKNEQHFDCKIKLKNGDWKGAEAAAFRKWFRDRPPTRNDGNRKNAEHNIESMLLTEFSRKDGEKKLRGIQPVQFAGKVRFPMPTALSASKHDKLRFAEGGKGGGVDILARVGSGPNSRLCVIEVKDENTSAEPPETALKQAISYAVFIRELLRSEAGPPWWALFGFRRSLPDTLTLCAACAMPMREPAAKDDESFGGKNLPIGGDSIECHYLYFSLSENKNALQTIKTSLP